MKLAIITVLAVALVAISVNFYISKHRRYACMNAQSACVAYWVK